MAFEINYKNKVVLVTGVSSGIGLGAAREFARAGAMVVGCSRKEEEHASIKRFKLEVGAFGVPPLYFSTDVSVEKDIKNLVEQTIKHCGQLDIVLSSAGMNVFKGAGECSEEDWKYNMDLNLTSHWRLAKACKPYLEQSPGGGVLLLMTSNHAFASIPGCFPYNVAKTAITGLVRSLAIEWSPKVRTVGIAPGFIDTTGNDTWFNSFEDANKERQRTIDLHPMKCIGTVEEVGTLCVYLASHMAKFICGTTILMDGGRAALMQDS